MRFSLGEMNMENSRFQHVLQVPLTHGGVIWASDLGDANFPRLWWAGIVADEAEGVLVLKHNLCLRRRAIPLLIFCEKTCCGRERP